MLLTRTQLDGLAYYINRELGRGTLPMGGVGLDGQFSAFLYNDLVSSDEDVDQVVTWVLTADALTRRAVGTFGLRPEMARGGRPTADQMLLKDFAQWWHHFADIGVAAMPMTLLNGYVASKRWEWDTQEVTAGMVASADDIASLGTDQHTVLVCGHPGGIDQRRQRLAVARGERRGDAFLVLGPLETGFVGAPAFVGVPNPASTDPNEMLLKCVGVVLPGEGQHPVATFDGIRSRLVALRPAQ